MSLFAYVAYDKGGKLVRGQVESASDTAAREQLRAKELFVKELRAASSAVSGSASVVSAGAPATATNHASFKPKGSKSQRLKDLGSFTRQLAVLIRTGTPLVDALTVLERQSPSGNWRNVIADIRTRVEEGTALATAMENHPGYFDAVARSLVAAGESRGQLGEMLQRLSSLVRQQAKIRSAFLGAMVYPMLLIVIAIAVINVMMFFVLPRFEGLFKNLGAPLPPTTQILMDISLFVRERWYVPLAALVAAGVSVKLWAASSAGQRQIDTFLVRAPFVGKVFRSFATARLARMLGVLLEGKVAMLEALRLTKHATGNVLYADLVTKAEDAVTIGEQIATALEHGGLVSGSVVEAVRSGERTGQIGPVLSSLADFMDEDNEVIVKSITSLIEPLILIVLGVIVGFVAISMFLPLFDLTAAGGGAR
jgi:type II secretory pathway component PulF